MVDGKAMAKSLERVPSFKSRYMVATLSLAKIIVRGRCPMQTSKDWHLPVRPGKSKRKMKRSGIIKE